MQAADQGVGWVVDVFAPGQSNGEMDTIIYLILQWIMRRCFEVRYAKSCSNPRRKISRCLKKFEGMTSPQQLFIQEMIARFFY